jgi:hypothetical protein
MNKPQILKLLAITLTREDTSRLKKHLVGWNHLNELLLLGSLTDQDLRKLIALEAMSPKPRPEIIRRLLARVKSNERDHILTVLNAHETAGT